MRTSRSKDNVLKCNLFSKVSHFFHLLPGLRAFFGITPLAHELLKLSSINGRLQSGISIQQLNSHALCIAQGQADINTTCSTEATVLLLVAMAGIHSRPSSLDEQTRLSAASQVECPGTTYCHGMLDANETRGELECTALSKSRSWT